MSLPPVQIPDLPRLNDYNIVYVLEEPRPSAVEREATRNLRRREKRMGVLWPSWPLSLNNRRVRDWWWVQWESMLRWGKRHG